jgi:hypothetical protein
LHLAREAPWYMMRLAGQAQYRRSRLNSNVRPHRHHLRHIDMSELQFICTRCKKPVVANREHYQVQEQMHWLCFHLEFEHEGDPDSPCADPSCPWGRLERLRNELRLQGLDPQVIEERALKRAYNL